jgi:Fur family ferric uptake transcriptional regulator
MVNHQREKEQFKKLFQNECIDRFDTRFKILEVFLSTEDHVTVSELGQLLEEGGNKLEPEFIRDTLKLMCRFGFAQIRTFNNGKTRYEHRHLGQHHDHMICTRCKKIVEFKNDQIENLQAQVAASHGFHTLQHKMEIYGICSECLRKRSQIISLVAAKQGERLIIKEYSGGKTARMRLLSMGLRIGDEIEVITNLGQGQMVIASGFNRFVLGRGLAMKIMAQSIPEK